MSRICQLIDEKISNTMGLSKAWRREGIEEAVKMILSENNTLFQSISKNLNNYPELKAAIRSILMEGTRLAWNPDQDDITQMQMYGLIRNDNGAVRIANRIFETRLYNLFLSEEEMKSNVFYSEGDQARNIFVEDGIVAPEDRPSQEANLGGLNAELAIHRALVEKCDPGMTYEEIFYKLNGIIRDLGFVNLDYHGNLGHSIEFDEWDRYYLEKGSTKTVREVGKPFTLEPHIALPEKGHGFKRENIYYIDGNSFKCL